MRHRHPPLPARALALAALGLLAAACQRGLEPPPAEVHLEAVLPDHGYAGDRVVLCAANLEAEASAHQVWFDGQPAEVLDWAAADGVTAAADCARGRLAVRVPLVDTTGAVAVKLASPDSQHSLDPGQLGGAGPFRYRGPGHPPADALGPPVRLRSQPISVRPLTLTGAPLRGRWLVTANTGSRLVQLVDVETGLALGLGTCELPMSAELLPAGWSLTGSGLEVELLAFAPVIAIDQQETFAVEPRLWRADIGLALDADGRFHTTSFASRELEPADLPPFVDPGSGAQRSLRPWRVWRRCRRDFAAAGCDRHDLIISHSDAPALAVLAGGDETDPQSLAMTLPDTAPVCDHALGPVADLIDHPDRLAAPQQADDRLLVTVATDHPQGLGTEIWSFSATGAGGQPRRLFPPPELPPLERELACGYRLAALAERRGGTDTPAELRLYAADSRLPLLLELAPIEPVGERLQLEVRRQTELPAPAFDLACARYTDADGEAAERLYAVTGEGVLAFDITAADAPVEQLGPLAAVEVLELDDARGGVQSLTVLRLFEPAAGPADSPTGADRVVLVDIDHDGWTTFEAGAERASRRSVPLTTSLPRVAPSGLLDGFFMADATCDVLRLVDRRTGVQGHQLAVGPSGGFSAGRLISISDPGYELLLQALPESPADRPAGIQDERTRYDRLMLTAIDPRADSGCGLESIERRVVTPGEAVPVPAGEEDPVFHQLQLVNTEPPQLVLLRYGHGDQPGLYLTAGLRTGPGESGAPPPLDDVLIPAASAELPPNLDRVEISPRSSVLGLRFSAGENTVLAVSDPARPALDDSELLAEVLEPQLASYVTHFAPLRAGTEERPHYLLALPMSVLGEVLLLDFAVSAFDPPQVETRRAFLPTGGAPLYVYASPDERRVYAVHPTEDLISIIDLDCQPLPDCARVVTTLETPDAPYEVQFGRSGAVGYVNHLFNNVVSVIE